MTKEQAIDQCRKINELVKRGIGGEQESAKRRLESIMSKHGLKMHDIEGEEMAWDSIICMGEEQYTFAVQVVCSVVGREYKGYKDRKRYYFQVPVSKIAEIKDKWAHYKPLWEKERETFYSAFIQKHKLYVKPNPNKEKDDTPLTPEERTKLMRMLQMMESMEYSDYKKKLLHK